MVAGSSGSWRVDPIRGGSLGQRRSVGVEGVRRRLVGVGVGVVDAGDGTVGWSASTMVPVIWPAAGEEAVAAGAAS